MGASWFCLMLQICVYIYMYIYIYVIICCSLLVFFLESQPFASRRHVSYADMSPSPEEEAMGSYIYSDFTGLLFRFFFAADQWVESLTIQQPILLTSWGDAWQSALHSLFDAENHGNVAWLKKKQLVDMQKDAGRIDHFQDSETSWLQSHFFCKAIQQKHIRLQSFQREIYGVEGFFDELGAGIVPPRFRQSV